ncbi:heterokaryon incompatibility protein-domain-containing protein [Podospora didyma]|uniref:Heterokaryon incompatibility protein-domain-containing protein n=1 Tax=Podospora didyma TaxID=330526 RepID=A0AAE0K2W0_9PEZI|nr:heterokaryon incompatibility protein-domain-containing protein [Podospora didyma]
MRLINLGTLQLEEFFDRDVPPHCILSHTWGTEEVTLRAMGTMPIRGFCKIASQLGSTSLRYGWVDTCCIDKTSSAELSEAINSMFRWYSNAARCIVFLADVEIMPYKGDDRIVSEKLWADLQASRWLTRGWTLQELLAPRHVEFFDKNGGRIGDPDSLNFSISAATRISHDELHPDGWQKANIARKMSWAARRQTTRVGDIAYYLLSLFNAKMPPLYGEGERAFLRLQEEILKESNDLPILAPSAKGSAT